MERSPPNSRDNELRVEKLFFRKDLAQKFDSGKLLDLGEFVSFVWHCHPSYVSDISLAFLKELLAYKRSGKPYTHEDWVRFSNKFSRSKSNRDIVLAKFLYLGLVEKVHRSSCRYEIRLSDKWIHYLEYMAQSWVWICENDSKVER